MERTVSHFQLLAIIMSTIIVVNTVRLEKQEISVYPKPSWMLKIVSGSVVVTVMRMIMMSVFVVFFVRFGSQVSMIAVRAGKGMKTRKYCKYQ